VVPSPLRVHARHGVREYWLLDAEVPKLEVYGLVEHGFEMVATADGGDVAHSRLFPGLSVRPAELVI
jgi:Uma2 family endonuclease